MESKTLDILCASKDRPMQLSAFLKTLVRYCKSDFTIYIVVKVTSEEYRDAYREVADFYSDERFKFILENNDNNYRTMCEKIVADKTNELILLTCDDTIYVNEFDINDKEVHNFSDNQISFSLKLSPNLTFCQPSGVDQSNPKGASINGEYFACDWTQNLSTLNDFGYPFDLGASIYEKKFLEKVVSKISHTSFKVPNEIESKIDLMKGEFKYKNVIKSYKKNVAVSPVLNRVQDFAKNKIINEVSTDELLRMFKEGKRMDTSIYDLKDYNCTHIGDYNIV